MSFKAKIKARLKAKWPGVNLSTKRIDALADKLKLEEDAEDEAIDEKLDELNDIFSFADMAKNDDRLRTLEAKQPKTEDPKPDTNPGPNTPDPEMPAWAKKLIDTNEALAAEVAAIKSGKTADTRKQTLENKLKDVDPKFKAATLKAFGRMKFESDEDFETYLSEIEEDAKEFVQTPDDDDDNDKVPFSRPLVPSGGGGGKSKQVSAVEADAILDKII